MDSDISRKRVIEDVYSFFLLLLFSSMPTSQFLVETADEWERGHSLTWALELCLLAAWQEEGTGEGHQAFPGATLHCSWLFSSVLALVVHSFVEALAQEETFEKKKKRETVWDFFFPYYILILQNRNYFILIVYYSSTFVEAQKNDASLNFSNYRNIYVTIVCFKNKSICVHVYIIYIHIYLYTYNLCFPVECIFMRF